MIGFNVKDLEIFDRMKNPPNYTEYVKMCISEDMEPTPLDTFISYIGTYLVARYRFTGVKAIDSCKALMQEANEIDGKTPSKVKTGGCGGCGK